MANILFVSALTVFFSILLCWGFKFLPEEKWQIMAAVPVGRVESDRWRGINFTYYGVLNANAYCMAVVLVFVLMGAVSVPLRGTFLLVAAVLLLCAPASRLIARVVEKKAYTFTVGGASFLGILIGPWVILLLNKTLGRMLDFYIPLLPALATLSISYAIGEGMGRLACVSFGCCYGKPLTQSHPLIRRIFRNHHFTFSGRTKKIAYASHMEGERVVPIQALTAIFYVGTGLICTALFLGSLYFAAFSVSLVVTQGWRAVSEILRADYRGDRKLSAYQVMSIIAAVYGLSLFYILPPTSVPALEPDILPGLRSLWQPSMLLFLESLWFATFYYTGRSMVTASTLSFHVLQERI